MPENSWRCGQEAIADMRELGIEIWVQRSESADKFSDQQFDYVLTVCDKANGGSPIFSG